VNLSDKFVTALLESEYTHLPTLSEFFPLFVFLVHPLTFLMPDSGHLPSMGDVLSAFILSAPIQEDAPYFEGYCGEHEMDHPGKEQLAGDPVAYADRLYVAGVFFQSFIILTSC